MGEDLSIRCRKESYKRPPNLQATSILNINSLCYFLGGVSENFIPLLLQCCSIKVLMWLLALKVKNAEMSKSF